VIVPFVMFDCAVPELLEVLQAFSILDKDGSGVVTTAEMSGTYDVSANPAVQSGKAPCSLMVMSWSGHGHARLLMCCF
jgi:hypothetical protein